MQQIIFNCGSYAYVGNRNIHFEFNVWLIGNDASNPASFFMTVTGRDMYDNSKILFESSTEIKNNSVNTSYVPGFNLIPPVQPDINESLGKLIEVFNQAIGVKKESGMWVPKISPGDTLIVDKIGASEVKVLDPEEQAFERVPKRALIVKEDGCSCPMRHIITHGCPKMKGATKCAA